LAINLKLLEIIYSQDEIIEKQKEIVAELINQNVEQESIINGLMSGAVEG